MRAACLVGVLPFDTKPSSPARLQHKHFSTSDHKTFWSVSRCGVFSKVTFSSTLMPGLPPLEGRLPSVQEGCWKLSAEVWGTGKTISLCLRTTLGNRERWKERPSESQEPLWSGVDTQYHSNSGNSIPLCASGQQLVPQGSNTSWAKSSVRYRHPSTSLVVAAVCSGLAWSPWAGCGRLGLPSPHCPRPSLGRSHHHPRSLQVLSPGVSGPQPT